MKKILLPILLSATLWGYGEKIIYWVPHGYESGKHFHGKHDQRESTILTLMNNEGNTSVHLILPDLSEKSLVFKANSVILPKPPMGGYYSMVAEGNDTNGVFSAVRYLSLQGRPSKVSPTKLTALPKAAFEIVPNPLHREHDHYTASKTYRFLITFKGTPLSHLPVILETQNGSKQILTTDVKGAVEVTLPNDFKNVRVGKGDNKPSEFLLHTQYGDGKTLFITSLSMPYFVNPNDYWQSETYGAGAIFIGFLGGLFLYRRHRKQRVSHG